MGKIKNRTMKKSSYKKLKEENAKLKDENKNLLDSIKELVNNPKSMRSIELNILYSRPIMTPILFGSSQKPPFQGRGLLNAVIPNSIEVHNSLLSDDCMSRLMLKPYIPEYLTIKNINLRDSGLPFLAEFIIPQDKLNDSGYLASHVKLGVTFKMPIEEIINLHHKL